MPQVEPIRTDRRGAAQVPADRALYWLRRAITAEARIVLLHVELDAAMRDRDAALLAIETLRTKEGS